jgi:hypothetical protein
MIIITHISSGLYILIHTDQDYTIEEFSNTFDKIYIWKSTICKKGILHEKL